MVANFTASLFTCAFDPIGFTISFFPMDKQLFPLINAKWTSPALDSFMATMSCLPVWILPMIVALALALVLGGFRARAMLVVLAIVIPVMDAGVSDTIKKLVNRPRPREAKAGVRVVDLQQATPRFLAVFKPATVRVTKAQPDSPSGHSFPSGHVINTFSAAMVISLFYRRRGPLAFIVAALVGYSRVYTGAHWPSDVVVTAFLGIGATPAVGGRAGTRVA